jgi:uncharacterized protein YabN with tetrapyrrole methylase and pyrophosphatase domain
MREAELGRHETISRIGDLLFALVNLSRFLGFTRKSLQLTNNSLSAVPARRNFAGARGLDLSRLTLPKWTRSG